MTCPADRREAVGTDFHPWWDAGRSSWAEARSCGVFRLQDVWPNTVLKKRMNRLYKVAGIGDIGLRSIDRAYQGHGRQRLGLAVAD